jgi:hypothetical protein
MIRTIKKTPTRKQIRKWVLELDLNLDEDCPEFDAGCVVMASAFHGPNADRCAKLLQLPRAQVREWGKRLVANGVWENGRVCADWDDEKTGGIAFWLDVTVALGWVERAPE